MGESTVKNVTGLEESLEVSQRKNDYQIIGEAVTLQMTTCILPSRYEQIHCSVVSVIPTLFSKKNQQDALLYSGGAKI